MARSDAKASVSLVFRLFVLLAAVALGSDRLGQSLGNKGRLTGLLVALRLDRG